MLLLPVLTLELMALHGPGKFKVHRPSVGGVVV